MEVLDLICVTKLPCIVQGIKVVARHLSLLVGFGMTSEMASSELKCSPCLAFVFLLP